MKLDDESKLLTTFSTPYGRYCFRRLPFGLISAQDVFQKKVDQTFKDLPSVIAIADDIVVFGKTEAEHDKHLEDVMKRTQQVGLCLNPDKCVMKSDRIKFFGNYLSSNEQEAGTDKIAAIVDMSPPTDALELLTFLGMANYLSRYTANLATKTAVLRDLTKKESVFVWGPEHQKAFDSVKETIATAATLAYFDSSKPVIIQTDASKRGIGATLLQDGRPVAYASKSLTETESNYCNIEREMLAIVFGLERFHHYAHGRRRAARRGQGGRLTTLNSRPGAVTTLNLGHVSIFYQVIFPVNKQGSIESPPRKQRLEKMRKKGRNKQL